jgi:hypothetical protein
MLDFAESRSYGPPALTPDDKRIRVGTPLYPLQHGFSMQLSMSGKPFDFGAIEHGR